MSNGQPAPGDGHARPGDGHPRNREIEEREQLERQLGPGTGTEGPGRRPNGPDTDPALPPDEQEPHRTGERAWSRERPGDGSRDPYRDRMRGSGGAAGRDLPYERSIPQLMRDLATEGADLVRYEIALVRAEMREKLQTYQRAAATMAIGGAMLVAALFAVFWAVNTALTALLAQWMSVEVAVWLAPLLLAGIFAGVGYAMIQGAKSRIKEEGITPEHTRASLEDNRSWARQRARSYKEEATHG